MAGDWIKIRPSLLTSPKVNGIAKWLESDCDVTRQLSTGFNGHMSEIVTRNVMRNVTVSALVTVWGAANEHTSDGVFKNADLSDLDDIAGIPNFGEAMLNVGWAIVDEDENTVTLPNFNEYNTCGKDRAKENNAERQRRYRERQKEKGLNSNAKSNVTNNVTSNDREEKRRIKEYKENSFNQFWSIWPKKVGKDPAMKSFLKLDLDDLLLTKILKAVKAQSAKWTDPQYIPNPSTWINQKRWDDELSTPPEQTRQRKVI